MKIASLPLLFALLIASLASPSRADIVIDFDETTPGVKPGDFYSGRGVSFANGSIPNAIAVGDIIDFTKRVDRFLILNVLSASPPNILFPSDDFVSFGGSVADILISLAAPASSISLDLDVALPGDPGADVVRLITLESTGVANRFRVIAFAEAIDNLPTPADPTPTRLSVTSATPFSFAIFQATTELEGFDNLRIVPAAAVPEPSSLALCGMASLAGLMVVARRRRLA